MNDLSQEGLAQELFGNFLDTLTVASTKLIIDLCEKGRSPDSFDKSEYLNYMVKEWKSKVKGILQKRINEYHETQSSAEDPPAGLELFNKIFSPPNVEDVQKNCNDAFKIACKRIDEVIKALKDE